MPLGREFQSGLPLSSTNVVRCRMRSQAAFRGGEGRIRKLMTINSNIEMFAFVIVILI